MRRHHQLCGCILLAFGMGILVGTWLTSAFWCHCLGLLLIFCGLLVVRKK